MALSNDEVRHLFDLARLSTTDEEVERMRHDFDGILDYMARLRDLDVDDIAPMTHGDVGALVLRDDVPTPCTPFAEAFREAPVRDDQVRVPRVVGEGSA